MIVPRRVTVLQTHPIQYMAPWFRWMSRACPDIDLTVLYAAVPDAEQQGTEFGRAFTWDVDLLSGYAHRVLLAPDPAHRFHSRDYAGLEVPGVGAAIAESRPDVLLVPGWHSRYYVQGAHAARRLGVPVLYRGDSNLLTAPRGPLRLAWELRTRLKLRLFDGYLAVGTRAREYLRHHGVIDPLIAASPAAVDVEFFADARAALAAEPAERTRARASLGAGPDDWLVLFAGKLVDRKRPADLLHAAAALGPGVAVAFAGTGELEPSLRQLAARSGVRAACHGFANQASMRQLYAAVDALVLPSGSGETWGLVVNEALAAGTPCVVSDHVGCAPDLIEPGVTGQVFPAGDIPALAAAIERTRVAVRGGRMTVADCQARARTHAFAAAAEGLRAATDRVVARRRLPIARVEGSPRILALCGGMVIVAGIERMTFEILSLATRRGAAVHCIVNTWDSARIVDLVDRAGGSWSTGFYWYPLSQTRDVRRVAEMLWDVCRTSVGLLIDAARFRPTHVFVPEYQSAIRSAPALWLLRASGVRVVLRLGNAPEPGRLKRWVWRRVVNGAVSEFVAISRFVLRELLAHGIPERKTRVIHNTAPSRPSGWPETVAPIPGRVVYVGQIIPPKGVDLLLEAVAHLAARGLDVSLDVAGNIDGWEPPDYAGYRDRLRARAAQPDLRDRVRFLGIRDDVPSLLARAAVHCAPSRLEQKEGLGNVVLEAKRVGVPSVVTPSGALPDIVDHGIDGWVCPQVNAESLAEGLAHFLVDSAIRARAATAARASSRRYGREPFDAAWGEVLQLRAGKIDAGRHSVPGEAC
jgi:glycosyltransferase involved in cell wall biosynthesis